MSTLSCHISLAFTKIMHSRNKNHLNFGAKICSIFSIHSGAKTDIFSSLKSQFSQIHNFFKNIIFHKIHISEISCLTKFTTIKIQRIFRIKNWIFALVCKNEIFGVVFREKFLEFFIHFYLSSWKENWLQKEWARISWSWSYPSHSAFLWRTQTGSTSNRVDDKFDHLGKKKKKNQQLLLT